MIEFPYPLRVGILGACRWNFFIATLLKRKKPISVVYVCAKPPIATSLCEFLREKNINCKHIANDTAPLHNLEKNSVILLTSSHSRIVTSSLRSDVPLYFLIDNYVYTPENIIPKLNFLFLFEQNDKNLKQIYHEQIWMGPGYEKFKKMCENCWNEYEDGFIVSNLVTREFFTIRQLLES